MFKSYLDENRNGYVEASEVDDFAYTIETSLRQYILKNKNKYYGASISLNNKSPWEIYTFVEVNVPNADITVEDDTNVLFQFQLVYKDISSNSFTMNIPLDTGLLEEQVDEYILTINLADGLYIDKGNTATGIVPYVFTNRTGLVIKNSDFDNLLEDRYNIKITKDSPEKNEKALYLLIGILSVIVAVIIFFTYVKVKENMLKREIENERAQRNEKKRSNKKERSKRKEEKRRRGR